MSEIDLRELAELEERVAAKQRRERTPIAEAALLYFDEQGWMVLPCKPRSKEPALRKWQHYQNQRPARHTVGKWFENPQRNVAIIPGTVSRGLIVRDFDTMEAYETWARAFPELARTLPTVATKRGRHVYLTCDVERVRERLGKRIASFPDGELRTAGYHLAPPSIHPDGVPYRWLIPVGDLIPKLDPFEVGLVGNLAAPLLWNGENREGAGALKITQSAECDGEDRETGDDGASAGRPRRTEDYSRESKTYGRKVRQESDWGDSPELRQRIEQAIQKSLPKQSGQRHKLVFELARALKAIPAIAGADAKQLKPYVRRWHKLALPYITTKAFEESWLDFAEGWQKVKFPLGQEPLAMIVATAKDHELPDAAQEYEQPQAKCLVAICRELQRATGEEPFYLSARVAGRLVNVPHTQAWRWLRVFQHDGILHEVSKGSQKAKQASRYFYLPPLEDEPETERAE